MTFHSPFVSVVVPNYNHSEYLRERLDSITQQTYPHYEIIILDDRSTDDSLDIIQSYANHPRVSTIVANPENSGSTFAQWNKGVQLARGELIWIAESDDVADPSLLERLVAAIATGPDVQLAYCQSWNMQADGSIDGTWLNQQQGRFCVLFSQDFTMDGLRFAEDILVQGNFIPNASAAVFRRAAYLACGGADPTIKNVSDWLTWIKICLQGQVAFVSQPLNYFRRHANSVISKAVQDGPAVTLTSDSTFRQTLDGYLADPAHPEWHRVYLKNHALWHKLIRNTSHHFAAERQWEQARLYHHQALALATTSEKALLQFKYYKACLQGFLKNRTSSKR